MEENEECKKEVCAKCKGTGKITVKHSKNPKLIGSAEIDCPLCFGGIRFILPALTPDTGLVECLRECVKIMEAYGTDAMKPTIFKAKTALEGR